ncbi:MAG TPA: DUF1700 domain-containing protein [Clostridiaceae bacterium]|nr:DUF1700 domain-containing protein [Clostridiaceae bacterium]
MKQHEFLRELKENLESRIPPEELEDILSDYESFFESGREEGKSDDEISEELGSPAFLAKSLLEEHTGKETMQQRKHICSPGRRLFAYVIDEVISVLPVLIIAFTITRNLALPNMMFLIYPSPLPGASIYLSYSAYTSLTERSSSGVIRTYVATKNGSTKTISETNSTNSARPKLLGSLIAYFGLAFYLFYSLACALLFKGQTIGKKIMRIRIRKSNADPATGSTIFYREFLGKILLNSIPIIPIISIFTILFTREHKALHDMLADTIIVEA